MVETQSQATNNNVARAHNNNVANPTVKDLLNMVKQLQDDNGKMVGQIQNLTQSQQTLNMSMNPTSMRTKLIVAKKRRRLPKPNHPKTPLATNINHHIVVDFELFSKFVMTVNLPNNFKLPITIHSCNGIGNPQTNVTMFKLMILLTV